MQSQIDVLKQLGFQVEFRDNKLIMKYPRSLIEAEILRQVLIAIPPQLRGKVKVKALGDIVVEAEIL